VIYTKGTSPALVYVKAGASGGNGTIGSPFGTIGAGINRVAGSGGIVLVLDGSYSESLRIPSNVTVRGIGADVTKLFGAGGCAVEFDQVQNAKVSGLAISGGQPPAGAALDDAGVCVYGGSSITVRNNILIGGKNGVRVDESNPVVNRNTVFEETNHGATLRYPQVGSAVEENVVASNSGTCIYLEIPTASAGAAGTFILNNVLFPASCSSVSSRTSLGGANAFVNPNLDANLVATALGTTTRGWNVGDEGTLDLAPGPEPQPVNAMDTLGLVVAVLVALAVAAFVLRRRGRGFGGK
jgi:nitrous oxidase accessory protein NosD